MKFPVSEIFTSIQGEGQRTGMPSVFIRLLGCNLKCVFKESMCDTPYTSFYCEKAMMDNVDDAIDTIKRLLVENQNVNDVVITGGEPLLYKDALNVFIKTLDEEFINMGRVIQFTVETNGSIEPIKFDNYPYDYPCILWSVSPKLSTSEDVNLKYLTPGQLEHHRKTRFNADSFAQYFGKILQDIPEEQVQFKFVYSDNSVIEEIDEWVARVYDVYVDKYNGFNFNEQYIKPMINQQIMLMPEGVDNELINKNAQECVEQCIKRGWRFCDRLHIRIWGNKRQV